MKSSKSGGGIASNKVANVGVRGGSPRVDVISPTSARQLGQSLAYPKDALPIATKPAAVQLGNAKALDVGSGGPGKGRDVNRTGSQARHGRNNE